MKICSITDCNSPAKARGWCWKHYHRWTTHGDPNKTKHSLKTDTEKFCELCERMMPLEEFFRGSGISYFKYCKECHKIWTRSRRHHTTPQVVKQMLERAKYCCEICGGNTKQWHIDHDHSCCAGNYSLCGGCLRGILCSSCNQGIGLMKESEVIMNSALLYLQNTRRSIQ